MFNCKGEISLHIQTNTRQYGEAGERLGEEQHTYCIVAFFCWISSAIWKLSVWVSSCLPLHHSLIASLCLPSFQSTTVQLYSTAGLSERDGDREFRHKRTVNIIFLYIKHQRSYIVCIYKVMHSTFSSFNEHGVFDAILNESYA